MEDIGDIRDVRGLVSRGDRGDRVKYLLFWGHRPRPDGRIGASCLSQWWPAPFAADGVTYASAEHWMMAGKARLFGDAEAAERAVAARTPAEAKKVGRLVRDFDGTVWERERFGLVVAGSVHKFGQNPELGGFLLGTGDRVLVEASPMDRIWGIGLAADDPRAEDPAAWRGLNLLGFALMEARAALRDGTVGAHGTDGTEGTEGI
ncbi:MULTISPECIES: NADAR family protein [unclassified Streptomyces]|uniref:NADAR family protein n=1 Tax=unclassified Streptomyces TaxID=2593676 RepID=UPI002255D583|nr:NADAR family protein [Streptomyces sp. NBC_00338]MCX5143265.1 NADAR family protein [Streptomyces sp. NBC_00338]